MTFAWWAPIAGLLWCLVVLSFYYLYNYGYYKEKIAVFGRFLLALVGSI